MSSATRNIRNPATEESYTSTPVDKILNTGTCVMKLREIKHPIFFNPTSRKLLCSPCHKRNENPNLYEEQGQFHRLSFMEPLWSKCYECSTYLIRFRPIQKCGACIRTALGNPDEIQDLGGIDVNEPGDITEPETIRLIHRQKTPPPEHSTYHGSATSLGPDKIINTALCTTNVHSPIFYNEISRKVHCKSCHQIAAKHKEGYQCHTQFHRLCLSRFQYYNCTYCKTRLLQTKEVKKCRDCIKTAQDQHQQIKEDGGIFVDPLLI